MKAELPVAVIAMALFSVVLVGLASAGGRLPGVSVGNQFKYTQRSFWMPSDPEEPMPAGLADVNMTDYYQVTVTGVSGSNVSTRVEWLFTNGTTIKTDGSVSTETTNFQGGYWVIIASNLNESDRVHPDSQQDLSTINGTLAWNPWNAPENRKDQRQTNYLILDFNYEQNNMPNSTYTEHVSTYFDRQTGALVHLEDVHTYHDPDEMLTVVWNLVSQNVWAGPETDQFPQTVVVVVGVVVAVAVLASVVIVFRRKSLKKTP